MKVIVPSAAVDVNMPDSVLVKAVVPLVLVDWKVVVGLIVVNVIVPEVELVVIVAVSLVEVVVRVE